MAFEMITWKWSVPADPGNLESIKMLFIHILKQLINATEN